MRLVHCNPVPGSLQFDNSNRLESVGGTGTGVPQAQEAVDGPAPESCEA